ncbi:hypothetical protein M3197_07265 [Sporosarcina aquimarina]|uniref:hypothetical protein n=1 Tax=Sporosarcina aquimarina TaxID=114975 RepID=UPI00203D4ECF|nr:hypothetical protein [Sporosarcina aquimarina]MCM3757288.1 hypothetical protein [Sporosarcina aquimarina]
MVNETEMKNGWPVAEYTSETFKKRMPSEEGKFYIRAITDIEEDTFSAFHAVPGEFEE